MLSQFTKRPLYVVKKNFKEQLGHYQSAKIKGEVNLVVREILNRRRDFSTDTFFRLDFELISRCYEDLVKNYPDPKERKTKANDWARNVSKVFQEVFERLNEIYFKDEDWLFPLDQKDPGIALLPSSIKSTSDGKRRIERHKMRVDLHLKEKLAYKVEYILFKIFSNSNIGYSRGLTIRLSKITQPWTEEIFVKYYPKLLDNRSSSNQSYFNRRVNLYQDFLEDEEIRYIIFEYIKNRYQMYSMKMRRLEYYMKNFKGEPIEIDSKMELDKFISNLRDNEQIVQIYNSPENRKNVVKNLYVEFDPSQLLTFKLGFKNIWRIQCLLTEAYLNFLQGLGLNFDVAYSGNKSIHISIPVNITQDFAAHFYQGFFSRIDPKNASKMTVKRRYMQPSMLSTLISLGLAVHVRLLMSETLKEIWSELPPVFLKLFVQENKGRELAITIDHSSNRSKGQFRTIFSMHKASGLLKIPLDFIEEEGVIMIHPNFYRYDYVKEMSEIKFWKGQSIYHNYEYFFPSSNGSEERIRKLLDSLLPELYVVLKYGLKAIDEMSKEELQSNIEKAYLILIELGIEFRDKVKLEEFLELIDKRFRYPKFV